MFIRFSNFVVFYLRYFSFIFLYMCKCGVYVCLSVNSEMILNVNFTRVRFCCVGAIVWLSAVDCRKESCCFVVRCQSLVVYHRCLLLLRDLMTVTVQKCGGSERGSSADEWVPVGRSAAEGRSFGAECQLPGRRRGG